MSHIFVNPSVDDEESILLIDASGSVRENFVGEQEVFDKFVEIIKEMPYKQHRVIFWNADSKNDSTFFTNGIYKVLPVVNKESNITQLFKLVKGNINNYCLTTPHIGFSAIPSEWLPANKKIVINIITDGQIGWNMCTIVNDLKNSLKKEIVNLQAKHPNTRLEIIAVERISRDFSVVENLSSAAGCDIYDVIQKNGLTNKITKFTSYTPNNLNGFVHIKNKIPLPGHIPFGDQDFSFTKIPQFIDYIRDEISKISNDEDELLKLIQKLVHTLTVMVKDKSVSTRDNNIKIFSDMFDGTVIDVFIVDMMLKDSVIKSTAGKAEVFANYRSNLKNLYKEAGNILVKDVKAAVGINDKFITLPYDDVPIISGAGKLVNKKLNIAGKDYNNSAIEMDGVIIPALPLISNANGSLMRQQCLRQWVRAIIGKMFRINVMEDRIIYIMLGFALQAKLSGIDDFKFIALVILNKKRLNVNKTEAEFIKEGNLPIPNDDKVEKLYAHLNYVNDIFFTKKYEPLTIWYAMCLTLFDDVTCAKQLMHCHEFINKDFPEIEPAKLLDAIKNDVKKVNLYQLSYNKYLEYTCPITCADTSNEGGWMLKSHQNHSGESCSPLFVMSDAGHNDFVKNVMFCPHCYTRINSYDFIHVDKKSNDTVELKISSNIFAPIPEEKTSPGCLIIMKGTVGAGKSTMSDMIKERVTAMGGYCCVEGMDRHRKKGLNPQQSIQMIKKSLIEAKKSTNPIKVIVIDTCGENTKETIFDVPFSKNEWKRINCFPNYIEKESENYSYWSLRNVLQRKPPTASDTHFLEPQSAGLDVCVNVHKTKLTSLFGQKAYKIKIEQTSARDVIEQINERADAYQELIDSELSLVKQVDDIIRQIA